MIDPEKVLLAISRLDNGVDPIKTYEKKRKGRGRPSVVWNVGDVKLTPVEYKAALRESNLVSKNGVVERRIGTTPMNDEEFEEMARRATPQLMHKAAVMALSDGASLKDVLATFKEFANFGYGKPKQSLNVVHGNKDIRRAWTEFDKYTRSKGLGVIDVIPDEVGE